MSKEDTREQIIAKATALFSKYGSRKTTIEDIAGALHKTKSALYHYFKSKEEILAAIIEKEGKSFKADIVQALESAYDPKGKLRAYVLTRLNGFVRLGNYYQALKDEFFEQYGFIERIRSKYDEFEYNMIKSILEDGCEQGLFAIKNIEITAFAIITALKGYEYQWVAPENREKMIQDIDHLLEVLFYGIAKR